MKLWLLKYINGLPIDDDPWEPWYDKNFGFVIRAETEHSARKIASGEHGAEDAKAWTEDKYSTCEELTPNGEEGSIICDFARE